MVYLFISLNHLQFSLSMFHSFQDVDLSSWLGLFLGILNGCLFFLLSVSDISLLV